MKLRWVWATVRLGMKYLDCVAAGAADERPEQPGGAGLHLAEANINPATGLATGYRRRLPSTS
jgi:hypothetical protein